MQGQEATVLDAVKDMCRRSQVRLLLHAYRTTARQEEQRAYAIPACVCVLQQDATTGNQRCTMCNGCLACCKGLSPHPGGAYMRTVPIAAFTTGAPAPLHVRHMGASSCTHHTVVPCGCRCTTACSRVPQCARRSPRGLSARATLYASCGIIGQSLAA